MTPEQRAKLVEAWEEAMTAGDTTLSCEEYLVLFEVYEDDERDNWDPDDGPRFEQRYPEGAP